MSLINCPECGASISDEAKSCPQCGKPLKHQTVKKMFFNKTFIIACSTIAIVLVMFVIFLFSNNRSLNDPSSIATMATTVKIMKNNFGNEYKDVTDNKEESQKYVYADYRLLGLKGELKFCFLNGKIIGWTFISEEYDDSTYKNTLEKLVNLFGQEDSSLGTNKDFKDSGLYLCYDWKKNDITYSLLRDFKYIHISYINWSNKKG